MRRRGSLGYSPVRKTFEIRKFIGTVEKELPWFSDLVWLRNVVKCGNFCKFFAGLLLYYARKRLTTLQRVVPFPA